MARPRTVKKFRVLVLTVILFVLVVLATFKPVALKSEPELLVDKNFNDKPSDPEAANVKQSGTENAGAGQDQQLVPAPMPPVEEKGALKDESSANEGPQSQPESGPKARPRPTTQDADATGQLTRMRPNRISPPKFKDDKDEVNNPHEFLGAIEEDDDLEQKLGGDMYEDESGGVGTEASVSEKFNKIGSLSHEDSPSKDPKIPSRYGKLGVPESLGKAMLNKVVTEAKRFPNIGEDFSEVEPLHFRIYSHNVKNGGHDILGPGEESWSARLPKIVNSIRFNALTNSIVTLQETYKFQLLDIMTEINRFYLQGDDSEWIYYGVGRIDADDMGELVPILWRRGEWEMVFYDTVWLNQKNERESLPGWDARYLRIVSYVTLKHKATGNYVNIFNTHFDHKGESARLGSAELVAKKMESINSWPSFLAGDLNTEPGELPYTSLTEKLVDTAKHVTPFNRYGHYESTVTGFEGEVLMKGGQNIDYIFGPKYMSRANAILDCEDKKAEAVGQKLFLRVDGFGLLHSKFNGVYMSDHRPLVADFYMDKGC